MINAFPAMNTGVIIDGDCMPLIRPGSNPNGIMLAHTRTRVTAKADLVLRKLALDLHLRLMQPFCLRQRKLEDGYANFVLPDPALNLQERLVIPIHDIYFSQAGIP